MVIAPTKPPLDPETATVIEPSADYSRNLVVDLIGAVALTFVGVGIMLVAIITPEPSYSFEPIGLMGFPLVIGLSIAILAAMQVVTVILEMRKYGKYGLSEGSEDEEFAPSSFARVLVVMAGGIAYLLLTPVLGFLLLTPIAVAGLLWLMHFRRKGWVAGIAIGFTVFAFGVFGKLLNAPFPHGITEDLLIWIGILDQFGQ